MRRPPLSDTTAGSPPMPHPLSTAAAASLLLAALPAQDVFSSFEFDNFTGNFTLGTAPFDCNFDNGLAQVIGVSWLYVSGSHAWMIDAGDIGTVTFGTPAEQLDFHVRDQFPDVNGVCKVFDTNNNEVASFNSTETGWTHVQLTAPVGGPYFDRITLQHNGTTGWTVIDDFSYWGLGGSSTGRIADPIPGGISPSPFQVHLTPIATGLVAPNLGVADPLGGDKLYVTEQTGVVWELDLTNGDRRIFHDTSARLVPLGVFGPGSFDERGLLGYAFHPDYAVNGLVYTYTSEPLAGPADFTTMPVGVLSDHQTVILEWTVASPSSPNPTVDPASARELLRIDQPQFNHNGGCIRFGPDGHLYIGLGDGGGADDRDGQLFLGNPIIGHTMAGNAQNACNILGTVLRIDPQGNNSTNGAYGIPVDNPFLGPNIFLDEIWAYGFRNPWRFSFDSVNGQLYLGDVGQNDIEEIDIVVSGGNYGWNFLEGSFFFDPNGDEPGFVTINNSGGPANLVDPIAEYDHDEGISMIGGHVYRGSRLPGLTGRYVFADWSREFFGNNGRLMHLVGGGPAGALIREIVPMNAVDMSPLGFGQDNDGELYVMANSTGTPSGLTGVIYRLDPAPTA
ncbi:MAG: PQQ-dependent sugar dehydrogenase, partial [Planctomycetes bacterium]|nr:PQQ-dependent sugar dehydrogenase [Planctomycetota bacterium]